MNFPSYFKYNIGLSLAADTVILRAEYYDKDKFPVEGRLTTIAAFRRNPNMG